ncbi:TetR/AcrR family transcriptional regulator [Arthrobacter crystallopoietes]|jgi:AcrR family transcriptional regulator|uniref:TetR/AcrR family transcriptional regulator n=1 Tax=Crystallibacter crystallopoietes TaxID=37928 RepID=UPI001ABE6C0A|nr:TetR/AcrR family transcriptional regulator [Arthrobacter crystallopoietes]QTG81204.1 TetR/AcrR family transcriptional regulator [Arthrobacter crystallopoietes]
MTLRIEADGRAETGAPVVVRLDPKERILAAAYELFSRRGIRDVGVDELIRESGVAKATFYRHFPSKDDLALAFLERRDQVWTTGYVVAEAMHRGDTAEQRLLAVFDVFDEWFQREDFEACSFVNVLLEMGAGHPLGQACVEYLGKIRGQLRRWADEAGLVETEAFSNSWHLLMKGSIILAAEGDRQAASRARKMGLRLLEEYRPRLEPVGDA